MECEKIIEDDCYSITWSVNNFSYCWQKRGEALASPPFKAKECEEAKWKLLLFPRGVFNDDCMTLCLREERYLKKVKNSEVKYRFELLDNNGLLLNFSEGKFPHVEGFVKTIFPKKELRHLPQDILMVRCKITFGGKAPTIRQLSARSIINVENISFIWCIEKFSSLKSDETRKFVIISASKEVMVKIKLFRTEAEFSDANIFMNICPIHQCMKYITLKTFILNSENNKMDFGQFECWFEDGKSSTFPLKITKNDLMNSKNNLLPNDVLTMSLELNISTGLAFEGIEKVFSVFTSLTSNKVNQSWRNCDAIEKISSCPCALTSDLMSLYQDQSLSDMKLQTKTNIFPVHTSILGARSPVFRAMFSSDMKEKINGRVDVSDLDDETVRRFLLYLYTDKLEDLNWNVALQLFKAADKYSVIPLKEKCSEFLKKNLQLENACEVLILSDLHQDEDLKVIAQIFILENAKEILKSEEWKLLLATYSNLAIETMSRNLIEDY